MKNISVGDKLYSAEYGVLEIVERGMISSGLSNYNTNSNRRHLSYSITKDINGNIIKTKNGHKQLFYDDCLTADNFKIPPTLKN